MKIILTSGPNFSQKVNGERKAIKLENKELIEQINNMVEQYNNLLFVCSSPDDYKKNEEFARIVEKSLSLAKIKFEHSDLLDSRNWLFTKSLVNNSNLVILLGGNPVEQIEFFNNIELKDKIKKFKGCLMGISAGSINMANYVYCSKDEEIDDSLHYRGLGLTNINVEPHFDINDKERIDGVLLPDSKDSSFIALPDESFITINNDEIKLYGNAYYFKEGNYKKIGDIKEIM